MFHFPVGNTLLTVLFILIYFGAVRHVLDRMRMRDKTALGFLAAIIIGSFVDIPATSAVTINLGGVVMVGVAVYLWITSGTAKEKIRSLIAAVVTGGVLYLAGLFFDASPEAIWLDPIYMYPIIAGVVGYLAGRSRRGAFFAAVMGMLSMDVTQYFYLRYYGIEQTVYIGGAGMFDSLVIASTLAVLLAELIGETREALQGGPETEGRPDALLEALRGPQSQTAPARKPISEPVPAEEYRARQENDHFPLEGDEGNA